MQQDTQSCRPGLTTCSTWPGLQQIIWFRNPATTPTLHLTNRFVSSDYYQCQVSGLQIWQMCCSIACCTSLQQPGHAGRRDVRIATEKTYLFCRVQGRRSKVFLCSDHLYHSQRGRARLFRRIAATGSSLVRIRSCWQAWKVKIRSLSVSCYLFFALCILRHPNKGRGVWMSPQTDGAREVPRDIDTSLLSSTRFTEHRTLTSYCCWVF